jgi:hypothetical protein
MGDRGDSAAIVIKTYLTDQSAELTYHWQLVVVSFGYYKK